MKSIFKNILFALFWLSADISFGQEAIDIRYLNSKFLDTTTNKDVMIVFMVTVPDTADFPPVIKIPPKCTVFENGFEKLVLLNPHNLHVTLNGADVSEKNPDIYELVKDSIDVKNFRTSMLITYKIVDIPFTFTKMSMTPAFNEKLRKDNRFEKRAVFVVSR